jgi:hypothetical protein
MEINVSSLLPNAHPTREAWLLAGVAALKAEFFKDKPLNTSKVRCSCGWTAKGKAIGVCHPPGTTELFICPTIAEPVRVLDILLHELGHAYCGNAVAHKAPFARLMREFGLEGKPTATIATPGTECHAKLARIAENLGPYPHAAMTKVRKTGSKKVEWVKLVSPIDPDYKFSVPLNPSIEEHGFPKDPWGNQMEEAD